MVLTVEVDLYLLNLKGTGSLPIIKVQIDGIEMPELLAQAATNQAEPLIINQYFFLLQLNMYLFLCCCFLDFSCLVWNVTLNVIWWAILLLLLLLLLMVMLLMLFFPHDYRSFDFIVITLLSKILLIARNVAQTVKLIPARLFSQRKCFVLERF